MVFARAGHEKLPSDYVKAVEIKLAELGFALSTRLHTRLQTLQPKELAKLQDWVWSVLSAKLGADKKHQPLFRSFPDDIPKDTGDLWLRKVLCHFLQSTDQPCLFCRRIGTTHVLDPCQHVICDCCFDGSNYSACPVCEHHVDTASPFFKPSAAQVRGLPAESVRFKLLDLCEDLDAAARGLLVGFFERKQALSPADKEDFSVLLRDYRERVLDWLPESIPVKENVAIVFGTLFQVCDPDAVLPVAARYLATATDVLRLIAVYSGADPSLQGQIVVRPEQRLEVPSRWWLQFAELLGARPPGPAIGTIWRRARINRFKVAPMRRALRRSLLALLEDMPADLLTEDMLRHRSYWIWIGQFLHPHEYKSRFPKVARAFAILRKKSPDGAPAPTFEGFYAKLETAARHGDARAMTELLTQRPGELARRFDHALRVAGQDNAAVGQLLDAFTSAVAEVSTPVLLTLRNFLPKRLERSKVRMFWPKGPVSRGVSVPDELPLLAPETVGSAVEAIEAELLRRFAEMPAFENCIIDVALQSIVAPFNERTASRSAVTLPRGSRIPVPSGKVARLFLHWCQPETDGATTDLDLSVGLYDSGWNYIGVCSYYELTYADARGRAVAKSAGDLRDAPFPDGATEFVDIDWALALEQGIRYAVMVVNSYAGLPFSLLERSFAGLMLRDDTGGKHFDPRTVELKFDLQGESGVYLPLVLDIREKTLHWLDTYSRGQFKFNNVETSNADIRKICPEMIEYFGSGTRMSMYELALLHAAARCRTVHLRSEKPQTFVRRIDEDNVAFLERLTNGPADETEAYRLDPAGPPGFAALYVGDLDLPAGSLCYALFQERATGMIAASDLIS